ncbi:MAG: DNA polymerase Y family protein [Acidimicrobiales bacterium]|nr:DNA polymerase Y family protein [Acidimicrobiales bacterium]
MERTLVVWCPDWAVTASGTPPEVPAAVVASNQVRASSAAARASGVTPGLRRREAQARCPDLVVLPSDPGREARRFEPVVRAVEAFCPEVEVYEPGRCALLTRGPARYFGGDRMLAAKVGEAVARAGEELGLSGPWWRVGVADGLFAACQAARQGVIVAEGGSPAFLAPFPVAALGQQELSGLLVRLGIRTLGALADLPRPVVLARFGPEGLLAHRRSRGYGDRPAARRPPRPEQVVVAELDPPAERSDAVAFAARGLAEELAERLGGQGLACTRLQVVVETEGGERLSRLWCHDGPLAAAAMVERVRWQLDAWLSGRDGTRDGDEAPDAPDAASRGGVTTLRLVADETMPAGGQQLGLWGRIAESDERAGRALARVQGMLGEEGVVTTVVGGGRSPSDRVAHLAWGEAAGTSVDEWRQVGRHGVPPWPGRVPPPSPALVFDPPWPVELTDADGRPVRVSSRGAESGAPAWLSLAGAGRVQVASWAGPWLADERWWDRSAHRRRARFQLVTAAGVAYLLACDRGTWAVEGTYD